MLADGVGGIAGLVGVFATLLVAVGFWRWGRARRTEVPLASVAKRAWREHAPPAATLHVDVDSDVAVHADTEELDALFAELFENAVTYGREGVTVRIVPTETGFAVTDDGPGIPEEQHERVFERGFTTRPDRDGLGLALVASICAGNGWDVALGGSDAGGTRIEISNVEFSDGWDGEVETAGQSGGDPS